MSATVSSYIPTASGTDARTRDALSFSFNARPQASTAYVRFIELGTILGASNDRVIQYGDGGNPNFRIDIGTAVYRVVHNNGEGSSVSASLAAAPAIGDIVELVGQLNADGSVVLIQSINGAASTTTTASSGIALAQAWEATNLYINSATTTTRVGFNAFMNIVVIRGAHSLARMRRFAGVKQ